MVIAPDWSRWPCRIPLTVTSAAELPDWPVSAAVNPTSLLKGRALDIRSVRVATVNARGEPAEAMVCQWEATGNGKRDVWWVMPGTTKANAKRRFLLLFAPSGHGHFRAPRRGWWNAETRQVTTLAYEVLFDDGAIRGLTLRHPGAPKGSVLDCLITSSGDTGWREQDGEVTRMEVPHAGPVRCVVEVEKNLLKDYRYTKRYEFFAGHFIVTTQINKHLCYTRAFYRVEGDCLDDKGHRTRVDGKGKGEGVAGKNPNPQWYQFTGDGWAHSCAAITRFSNISYWDGNGQIGFTGAKSLPCKVGYRLHPAPPSQTFVAAAAKLFKATINVTVGK